MPAISRRYRARLRAMLPHTTRHFSLYTDMTDKALPDRRVEDSRLLPLDTFALDEHMLFSISLYLCNTRDRGALLNIFVVSKGASLPL